MYRLLGKTSGETESKLQRKTEKNQTERGKNPVKLGKSDDELGTARWRQANRNKKKIKRNRGAQETGKTR